MQANVSHIRTFLECPTKAYYLHTLRRVKPHGLIEPLELGTAWHKAMETYLQTKDKAAGAAAALGYLQELGPLGEDLVDMWNVGLAKAYDVWFTKDDWKIIETEKVVEVPILPPHHTFIGTLDSVVLWNGRYWHLQHKTVHASKSLPAYWAYMQRDWHECAYQKMCELQNIYQPWGGTILNVVKKLSQKTMAQAPESAISIQYIARPQKIVDKAWYDLTEVVLRMAKQNDPLLQVNIDTVFQNRSMCAGMFGNSTCLYADVCNGIVSIRDDDEFTTEDDRYGSRIPAASEL